MKPTQYDGVRFYEDHPSGVKSIAPVSTEIGGAITSAQLASLNDVKAKMARQCKLLGGNAVIGFTYGQRSVGLIASLFSRDDVRWYGKGFAAVVKGE